MFGWLAEAGGIARQEMYRTFNCGIGMALVVAPDSSAAVLAALAGDGEAVFEIGRIAARGDRPAVTVEGTMIGSR